MTREGQRTIVASPEEVVARAVALTDLAGRQILGLVGAPGSGKSTIADMIARAVGPTAQVVEMDGYHLSNDLLTQLGRRDRKGAADTFDAAGYVDLLRRLRDGGSRPVYAPVFDRQLDLAVVGATAVEESCELVITTGNYLLLDEPPWCGVRELLNHAWFLEPDEDRRMSQLVARHERYGRTLEAARAWALNTDAPNAELVRGSRHNADLVLRLR